MKTTYAEGNSNVLSDVFEHAVFIFQTITWVANHLIYVLIMVVVM